MCHCIHCPEFKKKARVTSKIRDSRVVCRWYGCCVRKHRPVFIEAYRRTSIIHHQRRVCWERVGWESSSPDKRYCQTFRLWIWDSSISSLESVAWCGRTDRVPAVPEALSAPQCRGCFILTTKVKREEDVVWLKQQSGIDGLDCCGGVIDAFEL